MRIQVFVLAIASLLLQTAARAQVPGLPALDFQRYFPHLLAVSQVVIDQEFPLGMQYKFLTVRDEQDKEVYMALVRQEGSGRVVRVFAAKGPVEGSEAVLRTAAETFSKETPVPLKFEFLDLRSVRSLAELEAGPVTPVGAAPVAPAPAPP